MAMGCRDTTTIRKMMVNFTSSSDRAISLGVFWREAPSTRAIIRSMKDSPGWAVIRTLIQSDSTFVPPVTAERSPPDSRRSEEHTSELQSRPHLVCRLLLEKKKNQIITFQFLNKKKNKTNQ